jgi:hypothetical protein
MLELRNRPDTAGIRVQGSGSRVQECGVRNAVFGREQRVPRALDWDGNDPH